MRWIGLLSGLIKRLFSSKINLIAENIALRQQLSVYKRRNKRPHLTRFDRLFWIFLSKIWRNWKVALTIVQPETVIAWHRKAFRLFWTRKSQNRNNKGRPKVSIEIQKLIKQLSRENHTWGAPRIVKELKLLGFEVSESTVHRYRDRSTKPPSQTWKMFLKNHAHQTVSIDFCVVPTICFSVLYLFVILDNSRRKILHFNITKHPTAEWTAIQITQAFPWDTVPKYLIRDNDKIYGNAFKNTLKCLYIEDKPISPYCPWQNAYVERAIGSIRRECLDHVIVLNENHLYKIMKEYSEYYNTSRCHESLEGNSPEPRNIEIGDGSIHSIEYLGGLHHRYYRQVS